MERNHTVLRLGTRGSLLARTQSQLVADELEKLHAGLAVEVVIIKTTGDAINDRPLHEAGGKGLFTKELEHALLDGRIDFAVHSFKDVPVTMPLVDQIGLQIAATTAREDPRDVLVAKGVTAIRELRPGARVGTGSLRRRCQILSLRSDLVVEPVRGNVDTRLRQLSDGRFDAIVLAYAGLHRTGLFDASEMAIIASEEMLPCPGQGALALQCRRDDPRTADLLGVLNDPMAAACVAAERRLVAGLNGDCHSPIAALAEAADGGMLRMRAAIGGRDGAPPLIRAQAQSPSDDVHGLADAICHELLRQGASHLLAGR
jgi:hydroxymethylbilane synthase